MAVTMIIDRSLVVSKACHVIFLIVVSSILHAGSVNVATEPRATSLTCPQSTSNSIMFEFQSDTSRCDAYQVELVLNVTSRRPFFVRLLELDNPSLWQDGTPLGSANITTTIADLLPNQVYFARLRCHNTSAPSIVQGWFEDPNTKATLCATAKASVFAPSRVARYGPLQPSTIGLQWTWPIAMPSSPSQMATISLRSVLQTQPVKRLVSSQQNYTLFHDLPSDTTFEITVCAHGDNMVASDPVLVRTAAVKRELISMYRVSEYIPQVDFLDNHNSASFDGQVAFLTSTNDNLFFQLQNFPITEYCVEAIKPDPTKEMFADYASCNGPEAKPFNKPADPICICDVYADRMIALQSADEMNAACGNTTWYPDGSHNNPTCFCNNGTAAGNHTQWSPPLPSQTYVGQMPTWLPYFYYQLPLNKYNRKKFGYNWSTPKKGRCRGGNTPIDFTHARTTNASCTWKPHTDSRVIFGDRLLDMGWNNTVINHWPLHRYGPNTTEQILENLPVFTQAWNSLSQYMSPRCCGC